MTPCKIGKPRLKPDAVRALPEFQILTAKQRAFVLLLADGVPAHLAAFGAFEFETIEAAQKSVTGFIRSKKVRAVLAKLFPDPKAELVEELDRIIADPNATPTAVDAVVAKGILLGILPTNFSLRKMLEVMIP